MLLFPVRMCLFTVAFTSKCHNEHSGIKGHSRGQTQGPDVGISMCRHTERKNTSSVSYIRRARSMPLYNRTPREGLQIIAGLVGK